MYDSKCQVITISNSVQQFLLASDSNTHPIYLGGIHDWKLNSISYMNGKAEAEIGTWHLCH